MKLRPHVRTHYIAEWYTTLEVPKDAESIE
jgi:hypothetical protein